MPVFQRLAIIVCFVYSEKTLLSRKKLQDPLFRPIFRLAQEEPLIKRWSIHQRN